MARPWILTGIGGLASIGGGIYTMSQGAQLPNVEGYDVLSRGIGAGIAGFGLALLAHAIERRQDDRAHPGPRR